MPEIFDNPDGIEEAHEHDVTSKFEDWLNDQDGITMYDIDNIQMVLYMRLRALLTVEQLHQRLHFLIAQAEEVLRIPGSVMDEKGNVTQPVLVENFSGPEEVLEMFGSASTLEDDAAMAEWMASLVAENAEGEEE